MGVAVALIAVLLVACGGPVPSPTPVPTSVAVASPNTAPTSVTSSSPPLTVAPTTTPIVAPTISLAPASVAPTPTAAQTRTPRPATTRPAPTDRRTPSPATEPTPAIAPTSDPTPDAALPRLGGGHSTPHTLTITISDVAVGTLPHDEALLELPDDLPPLPWRVEAHTGFGRVLATLHVPTDYVAGTFIREVLSCGSILLWVGDAPTSGPPPPSFGPGESPGEDGDCDP